MKDNARKTAITILENAKAALKLKIESLEKAEDKIVGYDKKGSSVHEKKLKEAIKAHNEGKETPTANEHWNEAHKLGDHHHRGIVSLISSSKHGIGGGKKEVSLKDVKDHWPMHFNSHYGDKKEDKSTITSNVAPKHEDHPAEAHDAPKKSVQDLINEKESKSKDLEKAQLPGKSSAQMSEFKGIPQPPAPPSPAKTIATTPAIPKLKMPSLGKADKPLRAFVTKRNVKRIKG